MIKPRNDSELRTAQVHSLYSMYSAWFVLILGFVLTAAAWFFADRFVQDSAYKRFESNAKEITEAIGDRMAGYEQVLWATVGFFNASLSVNRQEFQTYVDSLNIQKNWPGIQGIGFSIPVDPADKALHEAGIRSQGFSGYSIKPEGARSEYSAIIYLEPFDWRNQRAFGYDMWSNQMRRDAMARARDNGIASTSGMITLVQETDDDVQKGFLTYLPLYRNGLPTDTLEQRRAAFEGWVYSPFRMGDLMKGVLGPGYADYNFEIFDGTVQDKDHLLFDSNDNFHADEPDDLHAVEFYTTLDLQGRVWKIRFTAAENPLTQSERNLPRAVLISGLVVSLLLFFIFYSLAMTQQRAEKIARNMTSELRSARELAEAANKSKSEFLATMSHEIRTPMTAVMGFSDMLLEQELPADVKNRIGKIKEATQSLLHIINDILDISKMEAGKLRIENTDVDLPELIDGILNLFGRNQEGNKKKIVDLIYAPSEDFPDRIHSDPTRIRQVLINLVGNAMKFTPEGYVRLETSVVESPDERPMLKFTVIDTGIGIPAHLAGTLFAEFTQADASITRKFEGTGLGLSICRRLVELMDGDIGFESEEGEGSTFWFTIPYIKPKEESTLPAGRNKDRESRQTATRALNVLVAEDNELNQQILSAVITGLGHTVDIANDGAELLRMHEQGNYDLILSDVRMPNVSGPDATRRIREMKNGKANVPVIAITADVTEENTNDYIAAGMNGVVSKPLKASELTDAIDRVMGEKLHQSLRTVPQTGQE
ncbi:MAG: CHASE domain-containing protein [Alphaproteobacteria bacterium]